MTLPSVLYISAAGVQHDLLADASVTALTNTELDTARATVCRADELLRTEANRRSWQGEDAFLDVRPRSWRPGPPTQGVIERNYFTENTIDTSRITNNTITPGPSRFSFYDQMRDIGTREPLGLLGTNINLDQDVISIRLHTSARESLDNAASRPNRPQHGWSMCTHHGVIEPDWPAYRACMGCNHIWRDEAQWHDTCAGMPDDGNPMIDLNQPNCPLCDEPFD